MYKALRKKCKKNRKLGYNHRRLGCNLLQPCNVVNIPIWGGEVDYRETRILSSTIELKDSKNLRKRRKL